MPTYVARQKGFDNIKMREVGEIFDYDGPEAPWMKKVDEGSEAELRDQAQHDPNLQAGLPKIDGTTAKMGPDNKPIVVPVGQVDANESGGAKSPEGLKADAKKDESLLAKAEKVAAHMFDKKDQPQPKGKGEDVI